VQTSTFVLVPGAGSGPFYWDRVRPELERAGHAVVAVDLPNWPGATLADQADAIVAAAAGAEPVVLVAQSMGGFSAPLTCDRLPVSWLVLLNAMIPAPGETAGAWWENTGQGAAARVNDLREGRDPDAGFDLATTFLHDIPPDILDAMPTAEDGGPADSLFETPCPLRGWPDVATTVLAGREDRLFPFDFQARVARERLGLEAEALPGGHLLALSQPAALVDRLLTGPEGTRPPARS
jgi:pimeloyl-ACP methyl ester carboxylesterase